ncbi:MAG: tryptophanyl-tRNA synthetase [Planctomycetota bacterium]|jgi:tryptophanyl-tRNA synthetase
MKKTVLSGMRATGKLHLGNYFGAAINYVKLQEEDLNCFYFIADWHSLTTQHNPALLKQNVKEVLVNYLACGIDPSKSSIYIQSDVKEISELYLYMNMFANMGELSKTASFKEKINAKNQSVNAGLLTYPTLMAADILIHRADLVPVGKDQEQHLEMTRTFSNRFNHTYKTDFLPEAQAYNFGNELVKIMSLNGEGKMSKSDGNENNAIFLADEPADILRKIKKAKTGNSPETNNEKKSPAVEGLFELMRLVSKEDTFNFFNENFNNCSIRYGDFKIQLAEDIITYFEPIREKIKELSADDKYLLKVSNDGAEKARINAKATLEGMRELIGINYFK